MGVQIRSEGKGALEGMGGREKKGEKGGKSVQATKKGTSYIEERVFWGNGTIVARKKKKEEKKKGL